MSPFVESTTRAATEPTNELTSSAGSRKGCRSEGVTPFGGRSILAGFRVGIKALIAWATDELARQRGRTGGGGATQGEQQRQ